MNLGRGFSRITWVVSISLFVFVLALTFLIGGGVPKSDEWQNAGEPQPVGDPIVFTFFKGQNYILSEVSGGDKTPWEIQKEIKDALDKVADEDFEKADKLRKAEGEKLKVKLEGKDTISYIYFRSPGEGSSTLYSRKEILRAEASDTLTRGEKALLADLRKTYNFPKSVSRYTFKDLVEWGATVILVSVIIPWGIFFLLRWIARGFRN